MSGFVDIHTHILPGIDDGAKDLAESLALLEKAYAAGTRAVFLTPHFRAHYRELKKETIEDAFSALKAAAGEKWPDLRLYLGREVHYQSSAPEWVSQGRIHTMNGTKFILLEFATSVTPSQVYAAIDEAQRWGLKIIVAHVERYDCFRRNFQMAEELWKMGVLLQLNADSILGKWGFSMKRYCHKMLKMGLAHFVASDAHDPEHRTPELSACFDRVRGKYSEDYAQYLFGGCAEETLEL